MLKYFNAPTCKSLGCKSSVCEYRLSNMGVVVIGKYFYTMLIFLFSMAAPIALAKEPPANLQFAHLLNDQGISVGSVEAIYRDHLGYMWFGGADGLVQYDGYNFVIYRNKSNDAGSLSSSIVWDIHEDKKGEIWIATEAGINLFNRKLGTFTHFQHDANKPDSLSMDATRSIAEDAMGNLWIATTQNGLSKLNAARNSFTNYYFNPDDTSSLASNEVRRVYIDRSGTVLWIGQYTHGLNRLDITTGEFTRYPYGSNDGKSSSHGGVLSIFQDKDGFIWLGTDDGGLNRLDPTKNEFTWSSPALFEGVVD